LSFSMNTVPLRKWPFVCLGYCCSTDSGSELGSKGGHLSSA
jgi:hypothetical protein